jgi:RNA polymerase sigma-70 factor (ECF subfamily)
METAWEVFEVRSALDRLPDEERQVVRLSHFDGLTHVEIAAHLDIPVGTVKSRSHRAHQRLVEMLRHVEET